MVPVVTSQGSNGNVDSPVGAETGEGQGTWPIEQGFLNTRRLEPDNSLVWGLLHALLNV